MEWRPDHPAFERLLRAFLQQVPAIYVVGGAVRDHFLGANGAKQSKTTDLDLAVDTAALPLARQVADTLGWAFYPLDEVRDVARLVFTANAGEPLVCDVARVREGSITNDLRLRDFTINAMAFAVEQMGKATLLDPFGGQRDLEAKLIRRVSAASLADDPARLLRAIRFSTQFGFALDEETRLQIKQICSTVSLASAERARDELWKMLATDNPAGAIDGLRQVGLLIHILPEVEEMVGVGQSYPHFEDVYQHTLRAMQNGVYLRNWILGKPLPVYGSGQLAADQAMARWQEMMTAHLVPLRKHFRAPLAAGRTRADWLVWTALLHDTGKPSTRTEEQQPNGSIRYRFFNHEEVSATMAERRLTALRFSRQEINLVRRVVAFHMRPHLLSSSFVGQTISKRAKFRFFRDTQSGLSNGPAPTAMAPSAPVSLTQRKIKRTQKQSTPIATGKTNGNYYANDGIDTLCLAIADYQAIHHHIHDSKEIYLHHSAELFDYIFDPVGFAISQQQPLVDGNTLMHALHLSPGRQIGQLLAAIQEAQAAGEIETTEAALMFAADELQRVTNSATE